MGFLYILNKVAAECGFNIDNVKERTYLTNKINEAARAVYRKQDIPFQLKECFVRVTANYEMSLPPFVGELRAIRSGCQDWCTEKWQLHTMFPKYNRQEWEHMWKGWRVKGTSPVAADFDNIAPVEIEVTTDILGFSDPDLVITIVGENSQSNNINESVTMTSRVMSATKSIQNFRRIYKNKKTDYNIIIKDSDGNEISMIYADQLDARFMIVDISKYPKNLVGCCSCPDGSFIMEVLFKPILPDMTLDSDSFPVDGYDEIIVLQTKQLLTDLEEGKEQRSILMRQDIKEKLNDINQDKKGTINKKINYSGDFTFRENGYYNYPVPNDYMHGNSWPY
jgi:hypothetical protein